MNCLRTQTEDLVLNTMLLNFLPVNLVVEECLAKVIYCECQDLLRTAFWNDVSKSKLIVVGPELERDTHIYTGSSKEGLVVPPYIRNKEGREEIVYRDVDNHTICMNHFELKHPNTGQVFTGRVCFIEQVSGDCPNYARLRFTEEFIFACRETVGHLTMDYLLNSTVTTYILDRLSTHHFSCTQHGPAVTVSETGKGREGCEVDHCLGIHFDYWPTVAKDFINRPRHSGWPDEELVNSIVKRGFEVTPVGRENSLTKCEEWRYSFSVSEQTLAHSITDLQRKVYVIVKLLHSFYFKEPAVFKTYYIKTTMFWLCERIPKSYWDNHVMSKMVCTFLDEIVHVLVSGYLQDYFIKGANLLSRAPASFRIELAKKIQYVRNNLFQCILSIDEKIKFLFPRVKLTEIFHGSIEHKYGKYIYLMKNPDDPSEQLVMGLARAMGFDIGELKSQHNKLLLSKFFGHVPKMCAPEYDPSPHTTLLFNSFVALSKDEDMNNMDSKFCEIVPDNTADIWMAEARVNIQIKLLINSFMHYSRFVPNRSSFASWALFINHLIGFLLEIDVPIPLIARVLYVLYFDYHHPAATVKQHLNPHTTEFEEIEPITTWYAKTMNDVEVQKRMSDHPGINAITKELMSNMSSLRESRFYPDTVSIYRAAYTSLFTKQTDIGSIKPKELLLPAIIISCLTQEKSI